MSTVPHTTKVIPVGYADISQFMSLDGDSEPMACTYGVRIDIGTISPAQLVECRAAWVDNVGDIMAPYYKTQNTRAVIGTAVGDPAVVEVAGTTAGTDTAVQSLPSNCALLVRKNTALGGRRNRGRFYIPGALPESAIDNLGILGPVGVSAYQTKLDGFLSQLTTPALTNVEDMVILHSYDWVGTADPGPPPGFPDPTTVTSLSVQALISTQRRRLRR